MCNDRIWTLLARKLSGEATPTELTELDILLSSSHIHQQSIKNIVHTWNSAHPQDEEFMEATYLAHIERMKDKGISIDAEANESYNEERKPKIFFSIKNLIVFSSLAILIIGTWYLVNASQTTTTENNVQANSLREVTTKKGNRTKIQLPDGSNVWLNAGSKINYSKNFEGKERVVFLNGEAFFDVVKNPQKPFIIHTSKIDIKVLGTQFNVKAYEEDNTTETSLIRGSVEIFLKNDPGKKILLRPNEKLVLNNDKTIRNEIAKKQIRNKALTETSKLHVAIKSLSYFNDIENVESSWTRNILSFDDEPFSEVAKKMERWYNVNIFFKNEKWQNRYLSGSFENETLDQALAALKFTTGFKFNIEGDNVSIY